MSEIPNEIRFDLKRSVLTYAAGGEEATASFVMLSAPTSRHSKECAFLKQAFFRALPKSDGQDEPEGTQEKPNGTQIMTIIAMSMDVDLAQVFDVAGRLFTQGGVAQVDGDHKLTKHLLEKLHQDDFEAMVGEYMANFTLASALEAMKEKSSAAS